MKTLLICISYHCAEGRYIYLNEVLDNIEKYKCSYDIIIDTNVGGEAHEGNVKVVEHPNIIHPFHLTQMHKKHFAENADNYENFLYIEGDMLIPYEAYLNYLENFKLLYPKYAPMFVRIEKKDNIEYLSDIIEQHKITETDIINIGSKQFFEIKFPQNHNGCWLMPAKELSESIKPNFCDVSDNRELNSNYISWGLQKKSLVEIVEKEGKYFIAENCYIYHLPNNYIESSLPNGKIEPKNVFI